MKRLFVFFVIFICALAPTVAHIEDIPVEYAITYELNGGTNYSGAPTTYTFGTETTISGTPTRANSAFGGWCDDAELTQNCAKTRTISDTDSGNKTLYAKWTCKTNYHSNADETACLGDQYVVSYNCGDGTGMPPADATATYGSTFSPTMTLQNSCAKDGYVLSGWLVSGTSTTVKAGFTYNYTMDKTLTAQWVEFVPKFTITTTNMDANTTFKFYIYNTGKYYVDWGDGTMQTIYRTSIGNILYSHTYTTAGSHKIMFAGATTGSGGGYGWGAIRFYGGTPAFVAGISGSLGAIFSGQHTGFAETFRGCTNLKGPIPQELFLGYTGSLNGGAFKGTFWGCSNLDGPIPEQLFSGSLVSTAKGNLFHTTFSGCSKLTGTIPSGLFSGLTGAGATNMFYNTFSGCSGLRGFVPSELFSGITGTATNMTAGTFNGTNLLTTCPCGTKSATTGWGATKVDSRAVCEVVTTPNPGEHFNNGICSKECAGGFNRLKTATGLDFPVLSDKTSEWSVALKNTANNTVCYVPTARGVGGLNFDVNGETYHATVPDEIIPPDFTGQPD